MMDLDLQKVLPAEGVHQERGQLNNGKEIFHEKADRFP